MPPLGVTPPPPILAASELYIIEEQSAHRVHTYLASGPSSALRLLTFFLKCFCTPQPPAEVLLRASRVAHGMSVRSPLVCIQEHHVQDRGCTLPLSLPPPPCPSHRSLMVSTDGAYRPGAIGGGIIYYAPRVEILATVTFGCLVVGCTSTHAEWYAKIVALHLQSDQSATLVSLSDATAIQQCG